MNTRAHAEDGATSLGIATFAFIVWLGALGGVLLACDAWRVCGVSRGSRAYRLSLNDINYVNTE